MSTDKHHEIMSNMNLIDPISRDLGKRISVATLETNLQSPTIEVVLQDTVSMIGHTVGMTTWNLINVSSWYHTWFRREMRDQAEESKSLAGFWFQTCSSIFNHHIQPRATKRDLKWVEFGGCPVLMIPGGDSSQWLFQVGCETWHMLHGAGTFTSIYLENHPNVGQYTSTMGRIWVGSSWYKLTIFVGIKDGVSEKFQLKWWKRLAFSGAHDPMIAWQLFEHFRKQ